MMIARLWNVLADVRLTLWLLVAIAADLFVGSYYMQNMPVFGKLNSELFPHWLMTRGDADSWWIILLFLLVGTLAVNTAACTLVRVHFLCRQRRGYRPVVFSLLLAPSAMHLCFLLTLGGLALSEFTGIRQRLPVTAGARTMVAGQQILLREKTCTFWSAPLPEDALRQCRAVVEISNENTTEKRTLAILEPVYWRDLSLHLCVTGKKCAPGMPTLEIIVRRDAGLPLILLGNGLLCLLMLWYFPQLRKVRNGRGRNLSE
jgi:hypothetical protein